MAKHFINAVFAFKTNITAEQSWTMKMPSLRNIFKLIISISLYLMALMGSLVFIIGDIGVIGGCGNSGDCSPEELALIILTGLLATLSLIIILAVPALYLSSEKFKNFFSQQKRTMLLIYFITWLVFISIFTRLFKFTI